MTMMDVGCRETADSPAGAGEEGRGLFGGRAGEAVEVRSCGG